MKKISHKILATVMAFVVLFSTMSFTIDMHFCGDTLVAVSMFQKATAIGRKDTRLFFRLFSVQRDTF